ncbi:MAG: hypothetical protein FWH03_00725 [Firmicutes bacterium]|nr:hypothetical protein [Bacillota bacterium]
MFNNFPFQFNFPSQGVECAFCLPNGQVIKVRFSSDQKKIYMQRQKRRFMLKQNILVLANQIHNANSIAQINTIAKMNNICDCCDYSGLHMDAAKYSLVAILESMNRFSELRSKMCFLGSDTAFAKLIADLERGDVTVLQKFGLDSILPSNEVQKITQLIKSNNASGEVNDNIAYAVAGGGLFDGIMLREKSFNNSSLFRTLINLSGGCKSGFSPTGCSSIKSIVDHEVGHLIDFSRGISSKKEFISYHGSLTSSDIRSGLSEYACHSIVEFFAEGYSEYCNNAYPREISKKIYSFIK